MSGTSLGAKAVLVVEDDPSGRTLLRMQLEELGVGTVHEVQNGKEAVDLLNSDTLIDVVISDIDMPVMDGITFLSHLRGGKIKSVKASLPVIMLTAMDDDVYVQSAERRGADSFLLKPVQAEVLRERLEAALTA